MSDYRVEVKIRNARFLRALAAIGETPTSFAKNRGFSISKVCAIAAMKDPPRYKDGMWRPEVMALCDEANILPSDLFTAKQLEPNGITSIARDVSEEALARVDAPEALAIGEDPLRGVEMRDLLAKMKSCLNWRQALAVDMLYQGCTADEIARELGGISRARANQIVSKARRKMREYACDKLKVSEADILRMLADG